MKRIWTVILFSALFLFISVMSWNDSEAANAPVQTGVAATITNDTGSGTLKPGDNLQTALDNLQEGGRLMLSEGDYGIDSPLVVNEKRGIVIEGEGRVNIIGSRVDFPILKLVNCDGVTIQNIHAVHRNDAKLENTEFEKPDGAVAYIESCGSVAFNACELEGCGVYGVYAVDTAAVDVNGCYLHHNSWRAIGIVNHNTRTLLTIKDSNITQNTGFIAYSEKSCTVSLEGENYISDNTPEAYKSSR